MWDINSGQASGPSFWSGHGKGALLQQGLGRRCRLYAAAFGGPAESPGRFVAAGGGAGANEVKVKRTDECFRFLFFGVSGVRLTKKKM